MRSNAKSAKATRPTLRDRIATDALFRTSADLPKIVDRRGNLTFVENGSQIPFDIDGQRLER